MRALVTGGSGAIGSFVTERLRERGHEVVAFDLDPPDVDGVDFVRGDVTDGDALADAVAGRAGPPAADAVVHLAALLPPACRADPRRAERVNVGGTLNAFEAATAADVRIAYASSKAVLGAIAGAHAHPTYEPLGEDAPIAPTDVYGATKAACERLARRYRADGLDAVALRFASTYGPGKAAAHGDLAFVPDLIRRAAAGEEVRLPGGDQRNDFVYYADVARGVAAAVEADAPDHAVYHVGSGEAVPVRAFADALRARTDATIRVEDGLDYRDADRPSYCRLDVSRAAHDLGYEPAFPVERAVADFLDRL